MFKEAKLGLIPQLSSLAITRKC